MECDVLTDQALEQVEKMAQIALGLKLGCLACVGDCRRLGFWLSVAERCSLVLQVYGSLKV